jgi:hypothetical protein
MIFVEDKAAGSTWQIKNVMLSSFAASAQAHCADHNGCRYYAQMHVRRVHQN